MRWVHLVLVLLMAGIWSSCSSTRWVHPTKKEEQLAADWNKCERDWTNLQGTSAGAQGIANNASLTRQRINRCLQKQGWRQIEEE